MPITVKMGLKMIAVPCVLLIVASSHAVSQKEAGMAGITAAKTVHDAGFTNFRILEATSRIGGRMEETKVGNYTVELGAAWIYGAGNSLIYKLANESNLSVKDDTYDNGWTVRDETGEDITDEADVVWQELEDILHKFDQKSKESKKYGLDDYTLRSGLRKLGWQPKTFLDENIEAYSIDFEMGVPHEDVSGSNYRTFEPFNLHSDDTFYMIDDEEGFSKIVRKMQENFRSNVLFNKQVTIIKRSGNKVQVITDGGSKYTADYVIVTFSVGVFQHHDVVFEPSLPNWKAATFDKTEIVPAMHMYLQFSSAFWDDTTEILFSPNRRGRNSLWTNMNSLYTGCNILLQSVLNEDSLRWDKLRNSEIINEVLDDLRLMYPNADITYPIDYAFKRWNSDPLYRGAWCNWPVYITDNDYDLLASPVGRIHFAGSYIHPDFSGYLDGAFETGKTSAEEVIKCLNGEASCKKGPESSYRGTCPKRKLLY